jgi:hypothetical protein
MTVTNEQILRVHPQVDSPLGRLLKGEIDRPEYERQVAAKWAREDRRGQMVTEINAGLRDGYGRLITPADQSDAETFAGEDDGPKPTYDLDVK